MTARSTSSSKTRRGAWPVTPLGDSALVLHFGKSSSNPSASTAQEVLSAVDKIRSATIPGVLEVAPAYTSLAVFFDPTRVEAVSPDVVIDSLTAQIQQIVSSRRETGATKSAARVVEIPVCYDPEFALDLDEVAQYTKLPVEKVVDLHQSATYRVSCVGFTPGFPYLSGLPDRLAVPRRSVPRKVIAAGSVAIGGKQTGIYPVNSPGGWNVIGRTPLQLFDPLENPPAVLRPGDSVRFRALTRAEFERSIK